MTGLSWDWGFAFSILPSLLEGLRLTVIATLLGSALAFMLGIVWAVLRVAGIPVVSRLVVFLINFVRGTPLLIQIYFIFYSLPNLGLTLPPLFCGVLALGLFYSALAAEVYRAGINAIDIGQWEACLSLGVPVPWMWRRMVLPQVFRSVLPMLGNLVIVMFKDSALLSTISVAEVLSTARDVAQEEFRFIEPFTVAAFLFLAVSLVVVLTGRFLEGRNGSVR